MEVLQRLHNRGSISTGYDIDNSLKVEKANTEYLKRTVSSAGNTKVWCASMWIKRSELDGSNQFWQFFSSMTSDGSGGYSSWPTRIGFFYSADQLWVDSRAGTGNKRLTSLARLRDTSAWYHIVVMQDTTQSTDTNRTKIYVNGTLLLPADLDYDQYPAQNDDTAMNVANSQIVVGAQGDGGYPWSGYIADVHFLDGQSGKTASDFGEYDDNGIWIPKAYAGAYGTNGFHLKFEDGSNMGLDSSGNGNNLTSNNITAADQATDTPTNNFCILNVTEPDVSNVLTYTEGATKISSTGSPYPTAKGTLGVSSGKWYWELKIGDVSNYPSTVSVIGMALPQHNSASYPHNNPGAHGYRNNGDKVTQGSAASYGDAWATNDIMGVAMDLDNNTLTFYRNNTSQGQAYTGFTETYLPFVYVDGTSAEVNFGGYTTISISSAESDENGYGSFEYAPPSGYLALCTKNLAEYG